MNWFYEAVNDSTALWAGHFYFEVKVKDGKKKFHPSLDKLQLDWRANHFTEVERDGKLYHHFVVRDTETKDEVIRKGGLGT